MKAGEHQSLGWQPLWEEQVFSVSSHQGRLWGAQGLTYLRCVILRGEFVSKSIHTVVVKCDNTKNTYT